MTKTQIMVVEDEGIVALSIQRNLENLGYSAPWVIASGEAAVTQALAQPPALILMDIMLADEMDGVEAANQIKKQVDIPIIYLTANSDEQTIQRAKLTEPYGYLLKPFAKRELKTAIEIAMYKHQMEKKLKQHAQELQARNEELDAFAHTVAHDLTSPLSVISGYADLLEKDCQSLSTEALLEFSQIIRRNARKMSSIVYELLLLASVRKQDEVKIGPVDMSRVVVNVQERLAYNIAEAGAKLITPARWPTVVGYGPWIEEVWTNYISNALKYGGRPPYIELGATKQADNMARFWVQDNGAGLKANEVKRLFVQFERLDQANIKGHGLGLSIVQRIVTRLGGQVGVESEGVAGQGSAFYFTLPLE